MTIKARVQTIQRLEKFLLNSPYLHSEPIQIINKYQKITENLVYWVCAMHKPSHHMAEKYIT